MKAGGREVRRGRSLGVLLGAWLLLLAAPAGAQLGGAECTPLSLATPPEREVVFLLDGSGSIDSGDWSLQKNALKAALADDGLLPRDSTVALSILQFSTAIDESSGESVPYVEVERCPTLIENETSVLLVESSVDVMVQLRRGTASGAAIAAAADFALAFGAAGTPERRVCLLTDGVDNAGTSPVQAAQDAEAAGLDRLSVVAVRDRDVFTEDQATVSYSSVPFGGGQFTYADSHGEFAALFADNCLAKPPRLRAFEVSQAVQDWQGTIPLLEDKATFVRVFLEPQVCPGPESASSTGRLRASRLHPTLPPTPLAGPVQPMNSTLRAEFDCLSSQFRGDATRGLNFRLPRAWLEGEVQLEVELPSGIDCGDGVVASSCTKTVTFESADFPAVGMVSLPSRRAFDSRSPSDPRPLRIPSFADLVEQVARSQAILPVARVDAGYYFFGIDLTEGVEYRFDAGTGTWKIDRREAPIIDRLKWYFWRSRCDDGVCPSDRIHGLVDHDAGVFGRSNPDGLPVSVSTLGDVGAPFETGHARNSAPHELAHNFQVQHTTNGSLFGFDESGRAFGACNDMISAVGQDPLHPYVYAIPGRTTWGGLRETIGPLELPATFRTLDDEIWGVAANIPDWEAHPGLAIADPFTDWAFMSYCRADIPADGQNWVSSPNYLDLIALFQATDYDEPLPPGTDDSSVWTAVSGIFDEATGELALAPVYDLPGPGPVDFEPGPYTLELVDGSGGVLSTTSFAAVASEPDLAEDPNTPDPAGPSFFVTVPSPGTPVAEVVVRQGATELARVSASATAPNVSILEPAPGATLAEEKVRFAWTAQDDDGDPLFHAVDYSNDDGATWMPLAVDLKEPSLELDRQWLRGGVASRFRVTTTDGLRSTTVVSGAFQVADNPPTVVLQSPGDGQRFASAQRILFEALAHDREDGMLDGAAVEWYSSRNGFLGTGASLEVGAEELREGDHLIAVRAVDSAGVAGGASGDIVVTRLARFQGGVPDFSLRIDPPARAINPGASTDFRVYVTSLNGFDDPVSLDVVDLPAGWTASFDPVTVSPGDASDLTLDAPVDAQEEGFPIIVRGTSGDLVHTTAATADLVFGLIPQCYGRIAGVVRDAYTGLPVEGVRSGPVQPFAETDAAGLFTTVDLVPNEYFVTISKEGYYEQRFQNVAVRCGDVTNLEVDLVPVRTGELSGRVVEGVVDPDSGAVVPTGNPIAGATVAASVFTSTDAEGDYLLTGIPLSTGNVARTWRFTASALGYWSQDALVEIRLDAPAAQDFALVEQCEVALTGSGVALDAFDQPVPGVQVSFDTGIFDPGLATFSGPDGTFELPETVTILEYNNSPREIGLVAQLPVGVDGFVQSNTQVADQCGPNRLDGYVVRVETLFPPEENTARVQGTVRDSETGEPLPGHTLYVLPDLSPLVSDANGAFDHEVVVGFGDDVSEEVHVDVRRSGTHWGGGSEPFVALAGQSYVQDVELLPIDVITVEGVVRDLESREPLADIEVNVQGFDRVEAITDANGFYRAEGVMPDPQNEPRFLTVFASQDPSADNGFVRYYTTQEQVFAEPGSSVMQDLDLLRQCDGGTIRGVVVNAETQEPLEDALVEIVSSNIEDLTDADGRFVLENILPAVNDPNAPRQVEVRASKSGFISAQKIVTIFCGAEIFLEFGAPVGGFGEIFGTVTDAGSGDPLEGVFVGSSFGGADTTDAAGEYLLENAPLTADGGPRVWRVTATRGFDSQVADVTVQSGAPTQQDFQFASDPALGIGVGDEESHFDPATRILTSRSTLTVTNTTSETVTGPLAATILIDRDGVAMPDASGADVDGNPVFLVLGDGVQLAPGAETSLELLFTRPAELAFLYDVQLTLGDPSVQLAATSLTAVGVLPPEADSDGDRWHDLLDDCPMDPDASCGAGTAAEPTVSARASWLRISGVAPAGAELATMGDGAVLIEQSGEFVIESPIAEGATSIDLVFVDDTGGTETHTIEVGTETVAGGSQP